MGLLGHHRAYEAGITFFDTARGYSDSEEKLGHALGDVREQIVLATKTLATDYVDVFQLHCPSALPTSRAT